MQKKLISLFVIFSLLSISAPISVAQAASCVSQAQFGKARKGMTLSQVAKVWGTNGSRVAFAKSGGQSSEVRNYKACSQFGAVAVSYLNGKLAAKSGVF